MNIIRMSIDESKLRLIDTDIQIVRSFGEEPYNRIKFLGDIQGKLVASLRSGSYSKLYEVNPLDEREGDVELKIPNAFTQGEYVEVTIYRVKEDKGYVTNSVRVGSSGKKAADVLLSGDEDVITKILMGVRGISLDVNEISRVLNEKGPDTENKEVLDRLFGVLSRIEVTTNNCEVLLRELGNVQDSISTSREQIMRSIGDEDPRSVKEILLDIERKMDNDQVGE